MMDTTKLSFRQVLRIAALEAASRVWQGSQITSSALIDHAKELEEYIGWGADDEVDVGEEERTYLGDVRP